MPDSMESLIEGIEQKDPGDHSGWIEMLKELKQDENAVHYLEGNMK